MTSDQNPASRRPSGTAAEPGPALRYLCFGGGGQVYLVHQVQLSPSFSRGFTVQVEVERELYLQINELS